jgi:mersacidin/lichenicidin family type 2 lantibiotic
MSHINVVRAWKDEEYRLSLTEAERALLPENPAGFLELAETDLHQVAGGNFAVTQFYTLYIGCLPATLTCNCW